MEAKIRAYLGHLKEITKLATSAKACRVLQRTENTEGVMKERLKEVSRLEVCCYISSQVYFKVILPNQLPLFGHTTHLLNISH
jgi:LytS/YehU family sensor histidine kinase